MFEQAFKNIDDVLWKEAGCTTELDYTEQTSWLLFLKYLDGLEQDRADEAAPDELKKSLLQQAFNGELTKDNERWAASDQGTPATVDQHHQLHQAEDGAMTVVRYQLSIVH